MYNVIKNYLKTGIFYGLLRGLTKSHNGLIIDENDTLSSKTRPLMLSEKGMITISNMLVSSVYSPLYIYRDVLEYELQLNNYKSPYKYKSTWDYITMV